MDNLMKVFPYVLIRLAGKSFENLGNLNVDRSLKIIDKIHLLEKELDELKYPICDALYETIAVKKDAKIQNLLLNFKRDVFNERKITAERVKALCHHLSDEINISLQNYLRIKQEIQDLWAEGKGIFPEEVAAVREYFRELVKDETLQKGLLLSSQSLHKSSSAYLKKDVNSLKKNDFQIEISLLKYISRICAKTSPFSTFTNLAMGKVISKGDNKDGKNFLSLGENENPSVVSHIRLNNFLYAFLRGLLTKNQEIYRNFLLRPNPTLKKNGDHYVYLINSNNIESFQRIPANPVLEVFRTLLIQEKQGMIYKDLVQCIIDNEYIDASAAELEAYINQLIDYGFLEFNIGVSGIDPDWDIKLRKKLRPLASDVPLVQELIATLKRIRELARQYGEAPLSDRQNILEAAFEQFRGICMKLHEAAGLPEEERKTPDELQEEHKKKQEKKKDEAKENAEVQSDSSSEEKNEQEFKHDTNTRFIFKPEQMFYEDTSPDISFEFAEQPFVEYISSLHHLLREMKMFEGQWNEREKMRHFFIQKYGATETVDLLTFYEDYYREVKKPEAEREEEKRKAAQQKSKEKNASRKETETEKKAENKTEKIFPVPEVTKRNERNKAWLHRFAEIMKENAKGNCPEITFSRKQIIMTHDKFPNFAPHPDRQTHNSFGVFVQMFSEKQKDGQEKLMGVVNILTSGFGKMISRFLHLFDDEITQDVRTWNQSLSRDTLFVEDCDASHFNANLHPPLMPYEVWMPNGHNSLSAEKQIAVTDLQVTVNKTDQSLQLLHKATQKAVNVFDLGFQGYMGRSQLFQLLAKFSIVEYLSPFPLVNAIFTSNESPRKGETQKSEKKIVYRPRIVYEQQIVLQRQKWFVPKALLPFKQTTENAWDYFARLNLWRQDQNIPDEIFVTVSPRGSLGNDENIAPEAFNKLGRDDYKPQYICFKNPLLVKLFEKLLRKVPHILRIEEMLPNSQQLLKMEKSRYVTEFVIQWYTYAEGEENWQTQPKHG